MRHVDTSAKSTWLIERLQGAAAEAESRGVSLELRVHGVVVRGRHGYRLIHWVQIRDGVTDILGHAIAECA